MGDGHVVAADIEDRIAGGLLGVHAGDALGATLEFQSWAAIRQGYPDGLRDIVGGGPFDWPAGHATDDTDLTRAVLLAYLDPGADLIRTAADHMVAWLRGDWPDRQSGEGPRDIGTTTSAGLRHYLETGDPARAGAGPGAAGNGSLMRCLPTALAVTDTDRRIDESFRISAVTHDDRRCTEACVAYNEIAAALLRGVERDEAVHIGREAVAGAVADAVELGIRLDLTSMVHNGPRDLPNGGTGFVLDSLSLAITAVLDPRPLAEVVVDVVRLGGDTDTNGAIAGGLLGVRDGAGAIPERWLDRLQFGQEFADAASRLAAAHA